MRSCETNVHIPKREMGTATFEAEYKPLTLMRYIRKAIDKDLLIVMPKK